MNSIRLNMLTKIMTSWSLILETPQSFRRLNLILLFIPFLTLTMGFVLAEESTSTMPDLVISSSMLVLPSTPVSKNSITKVSHTGRYQLFAQSQITPTITSYPAPLSPTATPTEIPREVTAEPYPGLAPESIGQPSIPYPESSPGQSPALNPEFAQTPTSQNPISPPAIGSDASGDAAISNDELAQTSSAVSAAILWIAFLAASLIFLSVIFWSILYFSRQRSRK